MQSIFFCIYHSAGMNVATRSGPKSSGKTADRFPSLDGTDWPVRKAVGKTIDRIVASRPDGWFSDSDWPLVRLLAESFVDWRAVSVKVRKCDPDGSSGVFDRLLRREKILGDRVRTVALTLRLSPPESERKRSARRHVAKRPLASVSELKPWA